jgi:hypothetical protein
MARAAFLFGEVSHALYLAGGECPYSRSPTCQEVLRITKTKAVACSMLHCRRRVGMSCPLWPACLRR